MNISVSFFLYIAFYPWLFLDSFLTEILISQVWRLKLQCSNLILHSIEIKILFQPHQKQCSEIFTSEHTHDVNTDNYQIILPFSFEIYSKYGKYLIYLIILIILLHLLFIESHVLIKLKQVLLFFFKLFFFINQIKSLSNILFVHPPCSFV